MSNKIEPLPVNAHKAIERKLGDRFVPCMVSGRYLEVAAESGGHFGAGEFIAINVMTVTQSNQPRRICELVLTREQLMAALAACKSPI